MEILKAITILVDTIVNNKKHQDYVRVNELAKKYKALITGEDVGFLLRKFNLREDDALFAQRELITTLITPSICNTLMNPTIKISGVKPLIKEIMYVNKDGRPDDKKEMEDKKKRVNYAVDHFYGDNNLDYYQNEKWRLLSFYDPNSFMLTTFDDFDYTKEIPKVYPTEISSKDAINYEYKNEILQWLIFYRTFKLNVKDSKKKIVEKDANYYMMFSDEVNIRYVQVDEKSEQYSQYIGLKELVLHDSTGTPIDPSEYQNVSKYSDTTFYLMWVSKSTLYRVDFFEHKSKKIPLVRAGFIKDIHTDQRTCVNLFHSAMPHLMKTIKSVSELDLSTSLHVFPRLISYVRRCPGVDKLHPCNGGSNPDGTQCTKCKGQGYEVHKSAQDSILLPMPIEKDEIMDLTKLAHYMAMPIETVKWLDEFTTSQAEKAITAVYNSDKYIKTGFNKTATEEMIDMQNIHDTLKPMFDHYSYIYTYIVGLIATFLDASENIIVIHQFPKNYKFESISELIAQLGAAKEAAASNEVITQINSDLLGVMLADRPVQLKKLELVQKFNPFFGRGEMDITTSLNSSFVPEATKVLYLNIKTIFDEIEIDQVKQKDAKNFYELPFSEQKVIVDEKVNALLLKVKAEQPKAQPLDNSFFSANPTV